VTTLFERLARTRPTEEKKQPQKDPAQLLLDWLQRWNKPTITPRQIRIYAPKYFRSQERVLGAADVLIQYGWLTALKPRGKNTHEWEIVRKNVIRPLVGS
jgi:hypothetical protein